MGTLQRQLSDGIAQLGLSVTEQQEQLLLDYLALLDKWNKAINLTAVRDINEMVSRHLLDSLSIQQHLTGTRFMDVGTGAGLPGIPMAILNPEQEWWLVDTNSKKTRFLSQAVHELGLNNVVVQHTRVESLQNADNFDGIVSRAFSSLSQMVNLTRHLLKPQGHFYAMKGVYPEEELLAIKTETKLIEVKPLHVPGCDGERHLAILTLAA